MVTRRRLLISAFAQPLNRLRLPYIGFPLVLAADGQRRSNDAGRSVREKPPPVRPYRRPSSVAADFSKRSEGAVRAFDFAPGIDIGPDARRSGYGNYGYSGDPSSLIPVLDGSQGLNALRFDVPGKSGSAASCEWYLNFSEDLNTQFGAGSRFFLQWRQRFNQAMCDTIVLQGSGNGSSAVKLLILAEQDTPSRHFDSCDTGSIVLTSFKNYRLLSMYHSCHASYDLNDYTKSGEYQFQNLAGGAGCYWQQIADGGGPVRAPSYPPDCAGFVPDEWMTFMVGVDIGQIGQGPTLNGSNSYKAYLGSRVRLWAGREGQPMRLVHDKPTHLWIEDPSLPSMYGKAWFGPYMSGKDPTLDHPLMQTWIAEIIVSKDAIVDPVTGALPPFAADRASAPAPQSALSSLQPGQIRSLGQFTDGTLTYARLEYGSLVSDPARSRILLLGGGGHTMGSTNDAGAFTGKVPFDVLYPSDTQDQQARGFIPDTLIYAATNHLVATHTFLGGCVRGDRYYLMTNGGYSVAAKFGMSLCDLITNKWSAIPVQRPWYYVSSAEVDPVSGKIIVLSINSSYYANMWLFDPAANVLSSAVSIEQFANGTVPPDIIYDLATDTFHCLEAITGDVHELKLDRTNFATSAYTKAAVSGDIPTGFGENASAFARIPSSGLITGCVINGTYRTYNPATKVWTLHQLRNEDGTPSTASMSYAYLALDPVTECVVFMDANGNVYAYRA